MVLHTLLMVVFVLVAISMIVLILLQRGAGAQAGSGFGAGASGTVFGSRGSANFLSSSTKWLAAVFFSLSLFMAWDAAHTAKRPATAEGAVPKADIGIMANAPAEAGKPAPKAGAPLPAAPAQNTLPAAAPAASGTAPQQPVIAPAGNAPPAGKGG